MKSFPFSSTAINEFQILEAPFIRKQIKISYIWSKIKDYRLTIQA